MSQVIWVRCPCGEDFGNATGKILAEDGRCEICCRTSEEVAHDRSAGVRARLDNSSIPTPEHLRMAAGADNPGT